MEREFEDFLSAANNNREVEETVTPSGERIDTNFNEMDYTFHTTGSENHSKKYLHTSFGDTFYFNEWTTTTHLHTLISCIVLLVLAVTHEMLRNANKCLNKRRQERDGQTADPDSNRIETKAWYRDYISTTLIMNGLLTGSQIALFYLLVIAVMTLNVWVYVSIVTGSVIGRFVPIAKLFPSLRSDTKTECHDAVNDLPGVTKTA